MEGDGHALERFVHAQAADYDRALAELRGGAKRSHWMWYIFPQLDGLGTSTMARRYAIRTLDEARAYLRHPILGPRLIECATAVLDVTGMSAHDIFGSPDDMKLHSSATLFARASDEPVFGSLLEKYFGGQPDELTDRLLRAGPEPG